MFRLKLLADQASIFLIAVDVKIQEDKASSSNLIDYTH